MAQPHKAIEELLKKGDVSSAVGKIKEQLNEINNMPLNIAITGKTGAGKSTFINAIRGLKDEDEGSALTSVVETTKEPIPYPHQDLPNVKIWDLPGIGSRRFKPDEYLKQVGFDHYDFFIIISSDHFKINDAKLAMEIKKRGKNFYFVRSKIDQSLLKKRRKKKFNKEKTLEKIRQKYIKKLGKLGVESPSVFLISSHEPISFDFSALEDTLIRDVPEQKRYVLPLAIPNLSLEVNCKKKEAFQATIWLLVVSAGGGVVSTPGSLLPVDTALLYSQTQKYRKAFGLDDCSLERLAKETNTHVADLKSVIKSPLVADLTIPRLIQLISQLGAVRFAMFSGELLHSIPVIGSLLEGSISFTTTYAFLQKSLNEIAEDGKNVLMKALGKETDHD